MSRVNTVLIVLITLVHPHLLNHLVPVVGSEGVEEEVGGGLREQGLGESNAVTPSGGGGNILYKNISC